MSASLVSALWRRPAGAYALLWLAALLYWGGEMARRDLWEPDEARFAYVAREMRDGGHWLVPHRHGEYYAHKPPLMFWLINASAVLTGGEFNALATRLPSVFGAVNAWWAVVMLMRLWGRGDRDLHAAIVAAATYLFWKQGGWGQIDMLLLGFQMLALYLLFSQDRTPSAARAAGAYACMGLAILAKGPVGFLVPLGAYLAAKLAAGEQADLKRWHWSWGTLLTLAFPALWLLLVARGQPPAGYLEELLFKQNIDRAQGDLGHQQPFYYFLQYFPLDGLPWTLLLPLAWRALGGTEEDRRLRRRLCGWALFVVVFFSLSPSKRNLYILLAYPAAAIGVAGAWGALSTASLAQRWTAGVALLPFIIALGCLLLGVFAPLFRLPEGVAPGGFLAGGAVMLVLLPGVWRWRMGEATGPMDWASPATLLRIGGAWMAVFTCAGAFILPCFNAIKTPAEIREIAAQHLGPGEPLFLYQINGEIQALYAGVSGRKILQEPDLKAVMDSRPHGLVIAEKRNRAKSDADPQPLPPALLPRLQTGEFRMGSKTMVWGEWGEPPRGSAPGAQAPKAEQPQGQQPE